MHNLFIACLALVISSSARASEDDWPTYGHGVQRQHSTKHQLAKKLNPEWEVSFPAPRPAWSSEPRMHIDMAYEPVLVGDTVFIGLNSTDEVIALDLASGKRKWSFFANGPVRRPPAVYEGKVYFTSDSGHCYCLDATSGKLKWMQSGGLTEKYVLGNGRIISQWAARSGVLVKDSKVYFGSGVWPFMGTFIQCLDAETGDVLWRNTRSSNFYSRHPHGAFGISGVSPQGPMALCGETLIVSNGRSRPMRFNAGTGKRLWFETGWQDGCASVAGAGDKYFNGAYLFDLETCTLGFSLADGRARKSWQFRPVVEGNHAWSPGKVIRRWNLDSRPMPFVDTNDKLRYDYPYKQLTSRKPLASSELAKSPSCDQVWIKAGGQLFAGKGKKLMALGAADGAELWSHTFQADIGSVIAGQRKLLVSTVDGSLHCFGEGTGTPKIVSYRETGNAEAPPSGVTKLNELLATGDENDGYCLVAGIENGDLVKALALKSDFHFVVGFDSDAEKIRKLHEELVSLGLYGTKVDLVTGDPAGLPPYLMKLICSERKLTAYDARMVFDKLRPYGGRACFDLAAKFEKLNLSGATVERKGDFVVLSRDGALPGAAHWTHNNGTPGNTMASEDTAIRGPLGVTWYGGPAGQDNFINRHDGAPRSLVARGRVFSQKKDLVTCYDAYTGQILWQKVIEGLTGILDKRAHIYTPNAFVTLGGNMVALPDALYAETGSQCLLLDPADGREQKAFRLPGDATWGTIQILDDTLVVLGDTQLNEEWKNPDEKRPEKKTHKFGFGTDPWNGGVHRALYALDRHTGKVLWKRDASYAYRSSGLALGNGKVFVIDFAPQAVVQRFARRGIKGSGDGAELVALDLKTGRELWKQAEGITGSWLGYSRQADVLVEVPDGTIHGYDEVMGRAWQGGNGKQLYEIKGKRFVGIVITGDRMHHWYAHDIRTGKALGYGSLNRGRGCNPHIGCPTMLTFRTSSSGYLDLTEARSGLVALTGFRPSCFGSLIPADGLLSAPNESTGCVCNYSIFTSLALAHMPDVDVWGAAREKAANDRIGINLGAPGDRTSEEGTTFFQYPLTAWRNRLRRSSPLQDRALEKAAGKRRDLVVSVVPDKPEEFQFPSMILPGEKLNWIGSSGMRGIEGIRLEFGRLQLRHGKLRLYFCEFEATAAGQRVLDVSINGKAVLPKVDVFKEAGGQKKMLVREIEHLDFGKELVIGLKPAAESKLEQAILCGIELIKQKP